MPAKSVKFCSVMAILYEPSLNALFVSDSGQRKVYMVALQRNTHTFMSVSSASVGTPSLPTASETLLPVTVRGMLYGLSSVSMAGSPCAVQAATWSSAYVTCDNTFNRDISLYGSNVTSYMSENTALAPVAGGASTYPSIAIQAPFIVAWGSTVRIKGTGVGALFSSAGVVLRTVIDPDAKWCSCLDAAPTDADTLICTVSLYSIDTMDQQMLVYVSFAMGNVGLTVQTPQIMYLTQPRLSITYPQPTTINPFNSSALVIFTLPAGIPASTSSVCSGGHVCFLNEVYLGLTLLSCNTTDRQTYMCAIPTGVNSGRRIFFRACNSLNDISSDGMSSGSSVETYITNGYIYQPNITKLTITLDSSTLKATGNISGAGLDYISGALERLDVVNPFDSTAIVSCRNFVSVNANTGTCTLWSPVSQLQAFFTPAGARSVSLSAVARIYAQSLPVSLPLPSVTVFRSPVIHAVVPTDVLQGTQIAILGHYFTPSTGLQVMLGSVACDSISVVSDASILCTVPSLLGPSHSPTYPIFAVQVITTVAGASNGLTNITVATDCTLSIAAGNYSALPSSVAAVFPVSPSIHLTATGSGTISCSASLSKVDSTCFASTAPSGLTAGRYPSLSTVSVVGDTAVTSATTRAMSFAQSRVVCSWRLQVYSGCYVSR
jgi:hypothetical protein